jgi:hypothetical protein
MNVASINWLAVLVAGLSAFIAGGIWYSPQLFGNIWMRENGFTQEQLQKSNKSRAFGFTAVFSLLMAVNLAMFLASPSQKCGDCAPTPNMSWGMTAGFLTGIWTFAAIAIHSLFEQKSWKLIFINGGYSVVSLILMGAILGLWR